MKKILITLSLAFWAQNQTKACSWYDPDYEYFNLFTQTIIKDKSYTPFLLTYSNWFYGDSKVKMPDDNIDDWKKYFGNDLSYAEIQHLVYHIPLNDLNDLKNGKPTDGLLKKLGTPFYTKYKEGVDYLIEAKYLEPYARIKYISSPDDFYYGRNEDQKNATQLDYAKTLTSLEKLYASVKNPSIKLRYGYQMVRFNHYNREFVSAADAFKKYVEPLKLKTAPYYMALDQLAGAQRGLGKNDDANWNFFQVLLHSKRDKESAFKSMKLSDSATFQKMINRASTTEEKSMAHFILGFQDFNNPISAMEEIYKLDPHSELLKVLASRAINELERNYLPTYYNSHDETAQNVAENESTTTKTEVKKELTFWEKVARFFRNLFGKDKDEKVERSSTLSDKQYLKNPNRIPFAAYASYENEDKKIKAEKQLEELSKLTEKIADKDGDEFWKVSDAYLKFLGKEYDESKEILSKIKTDNAEYKEQIARMQMLNEIVAEPKITKEFEDQMFAKYKNYFSDDKTKIKDSLNAEQDFYEMDPPSTKEFLLDILANRYFLQGEDAKSFLMNNKLSDFSWNPNLELAQKLEAFYNKKDKSTFEKEFITKNMDEVGNPSSYFNLIYGDFAMRNGKFAEAKNFYKKAEQFKGYNLPTEYYDYQLGDYKKVENKNELYDGFRNISPLVFGHNTWVSYGTSEDISMKAESFVSEFPFIKSKMNKLELAETLLELQKIAAGKNLAASHANQLIGNALYNTSILGYYRHYFVMDVDNSNGGKYNFNTGESPFTFYYKNYYSSSFINPDNFDLSISYYQKALNLTSDREEKARLLFQMASAEQGKYYQWETKQPSIPWSAENFSELRDKQELEFRKMKNEKFKTYFGQLKANYSDTKTSLELRSSCSYYDNFMK